MLSKNVLVDFEPELKKKFESPPPLLEISLNTPLAIARALPYVFFVVFSAIGVDGLRKKFGLPENVPA
jgi:hypothetical protein